MREKKVFNFENYVDSISLNEKKNRKSKNLDKRYGCIMLYFNFPKMKELHKSIEEEDIYSKDGYGLETEPHCTLLYGLHDEEIENDDDVINSVLKHIKKGMAITLYNASLFENDYDVLKFDVKQTMLDKDENEEYSKKDDCLFKANKELTKNYPFTTDFPDYHPHYTIVYLNKGEGKKYVKEFKDKEFYITPNKLVYSKSNGEKVERIIKDKKL